MPVTVQQLANQLNLDYQGESELQLNGVGSLSSAQAGELSFLIKPANKQALQSQCSALVVPLGFEQDAGQKTLIYASNPHQSFIEAIQIICPERLNKPASGIHPSAQIAESAAIADGVSIGALTVIGEGAELGSECQIGAGCVIEAQAVLGKQCQLHSRVTLAHGVRVGDRCEFHAGVVIGSDGFGLIENDQQWIKVPQIGTVIIGDDVEIGANSTVDRGALDDTVIEQGCKLDNLIQVAHNVHIGAHTAIAACVGIAGSAKIGRHCRISGAAVVLGHLSITDNVTITAMSLVTKDIKESGVYSSGTPLLANSEWHKCNARYKSLDTLAKTVSKLDKQSG